ncbi:MAG: hypothetical protein ACKOI2_06935 [Actinomycetota bacterium]
MERTVLTKWDFDCSEGSVTADRFVTLIGEFNVDVTRRQPGSMWEKFDDAI